MKRFLAVLLLSMALCGTRLAAQSGREGPYPQLPDDAVREPASTGVPMPQSRVPLPAQPHTNVPQYIPQPQPYAAPEPTPYSNNIIPAETAAGGTNAAVAPQPTPLTNVTNGGSIPPNIPTPLAVTATPLPLVATPEPMAAATPIPVQTNVQKTRPEPSGTPQIENENPAPGNLRSANSNAAPSPLWKVGGVVLTLLGLLVLVVFSPVFSVLSKVQQALIYAGAGCAGLAQLADTFSGVSPAASPAQSMLMLAGFGGIAASGVVDGHRNRAAAGLLWLSASALITHSLSYGSQAANMFSGILAITASVCALALCAVAFSVPATEEEDATSFARNAPTPTVLRPTAAPSAPRPAMAAAATARNPVAARPGARQTGKNVARLVATEGTLKGQVFTLVDGANAAGADAAALDGNKIHLPGDDKVSRIHAIVMCSGNRCTISDMKSANGVFLNGGQVLDERDLMNGDRLQIGGTVFVYQRG